MLHSLARVGAVLFALTVLFSLVLHAGCRTTKDPETPNTTVNPVDPDQEPTNQQAPTKTEPGANNPPPSSEPIFLPPTKAAPVFLPPTKSGKIVQPQSAPQSVPAQQPSKKNNSNKPKVMPGTKSGGLF